ncbi:hypothetical protein L7F22_051274 [Adiantum nelumboides]|nr:hypothetical protein [Adiantum nelumboides]
MKELVPQDATKRIKHIQFGVLSAQEIVGMSELECTTRDMYALRQDGGERYPVSHGVLDRRLGISDKFNSCDTCGLKMSDCVGHYGYIKLVLPVFHIGFLKHIISILQVICKSCATVLLDEHARRKYLSIFRRRNLENLQRTQTFKAVQTAAKKVLYCPRCGCTNGVVKKFGALKIVHEKFRAKKTESEKEAFRRTFDSAVKLGGTGPGDLATHLAKAQDDLNPLKVLDLFKRISDEVSTQRW